MVDSMLVGMDSRDGTGMGPMFEITQRDEADGALRVALSGELDLAVSNRLRLGLRELGRGMRPVRLDLSALDFIDCSGVGAIVGALAEARRGRWELEVDRAVSPIVDRVIALTGVAADLWPVEAVH